MGKNKSEFIDALAPFILDRSSFKHYMNNFGRTLDSIFSFYKEVVYSLLIQTSEYHFEFKEGSYNNLNLLSMFDNLKQKKRKAPSHRFYDLFPELKVRGQTVDKNYSFKGVFKKVHKKKNTRLSATMLEHHSFFNDFFLCLIYTANKNIILNKERLKLETINDSSRILRKIIKILYHQDSTQGLKYLDYEEDIDSLISSGQSELSIAGEGLVKNFESELKRNLYPNLSPKVFHDFLIETHKYFSLVQSLKSKFIEKPSTHNKREIPTISTEAVKSDIYLTIGNYLKHNYETSNELNLLTFTSRLFEVFIKIEIKNPNDFFKNQRVKEIPSNK